MNNTTNIKKGQLVDLSQLSIKINKTISFLRFALTALSIRSEKTGDKMSLDLNKQTLLAADVLQHDFKLFDTANFDMFRRYEAMGGKPACYDSECCFPDCDKCAVVEEICKN